MKGVAVPVVLHVALHVVLQGTLRNVKAVAVPVAIHVVLQGTLRNVNGVAVPVVLHVLLHGQGFKRSEKPIKTQCFSRFGSIGWLCVWHLPVV